jgi:3-phenylpropionate/trans-cinnamate dioxygenase ferredoxin reductase component
MERIVVAGASIAGMSAARELRRLGFSGTIQLVDEDPHAPYRRPEVSKTLLTGARQLVDVVAPWSQDLALERVAGVRLTALDLAQRTVHGHSDDGDITLGYDGLVIATGSVARQWPVQLGLDGVVSLRSAEDSLGMRALLADAKRVAIVGAGFIGLEVASSATALGVAATVIEMAEIPLAHALGVELGERLAAAHRARGVELRCGVGVERIEGGTRVERIVLQDGSVVEADVVLVAIGATPAVGWLESSGLDLSAGVACDSCCRVLGAESVVAAGDVASWVNPLYDRRMRVEHWTNAIQQATFAAGALLGVAPEEGFSSAPYFWSDQFDLKLQSYGTSVGHDAAAVLEDTDEQMIVAYGREGILIGVATLNAGIAAHKYRPLIEARTPLDDVSSMPLTGQAAR